jgi:hypothetical protein
MDTAKYLGAFISSNSSGRCKLSLLPGFNSLPHSLTLSSTPADSSQEKIQIYSHIVQAILLHGAESQVYSPAQVTKINSLHYEALRQILQV